jgi:23S rRNA (guanosine2251-2'-O)-methyltransferase
MKEEFIFGKNSVEALLTQSDRPVNKIFLLSTTNRDARIQKILKLARNQKIPVTEISKDKVNKMFETQVNHQGIIASVSPVDYIEIDDLVEGLADKKDLPLLILLDNVEDPQNMGSIIRTSEFLGADGVVITKRRGAQVTGTVCKASSGATEFISLVRVENMVNTIKYLKENNFWIAGAENDPLAKHVYEVDLKIPLAIVMGSEGKGISRLAKENCDFIIKIPQYGRVSSLNVANALSMILYEVIRQRVTN